MLLKTHAHTVTETHDAESGDTTETNVHRYTFVTPDTKDRFIIQSDIACDFEVGHGYDRSEIARRSTPAVEKAGSLAKADTRTGA